MEKTIQGNGEFRRVAIANNTVKASAINGIDFLRGLSVNGEQFTFSHRLFDPDCNIIGWVLKSGVNELFVENA